MIGEPSCNGCMYSGHPHIETCPEAMHNKYPNHNLTIMELFSTNLKRVIRWHPVAGLNEWSALEWAGAMCGEAGEASNAAKKLKRLECNLKSINEIGRHFNDLDEAKEAVAREVADTIIYGLLLMARVGIKDPDKIIRDVFNKKSEEYGFPERI